MNKQIMFWARECPHCKKMMPLVDKLEKETGIELEKLEICRLLLPNVEASCGRPLL
jgi:glutaredoxin-related protein